MQCDKCGEKLSPSHAFCPFCGALNKNNTVKTVIKKPSSAYSSPYFEVFEKDTVYENPNKAYDNNANEFYKPHSLPRSDRHGSNRRHRRKHKNRFLRVALPTIALLFAFVGAYLGLKTLVFQPKINIRGIWIASSISGDATGDTYYFTNDGFVTVKSSVYQSSDKGTKYCWRIEGKKLIVDNTTYYWNTNLNDYSDPSNEHWCVSGNTIYISNTHNDGYKILNKNVK